MSEELVSRSEIKGTVNLVMPTEKAAFIVKQSLEVDDELQPNKIRKEFEVVHPSTLVM